MSLGSEIRISSTTKEIIERYYEWKRQQHTGQESQPLDEDDGHTDDPEDRLENDYDNDE